MSEIPDHQFDDPELFYKISFRIRNTAHEISN